MRIVAGGMLLAVALAGCGTPQSLPLDIRQCDAVRTARGITLTALVTSRATKPISGLSLSVDFYRDFVSSSLQVSMPVRPELDPGQQRSIVFRMVAPTQARAQGRALRCFATHIDYLDGTSESVAPTR